MHESCHGVSQRGDRDLTNKWLGFAKARQIDGDHVAPRC
jgi:hypothetical protein